MMQGKKSIKKNGHTAQCIFNINMEMIEKNIKYFLLEVERNFSIKNTSKMKRMNVTICALGAM